MATIAAKRWTLNSQLLLAIQNKDVIRASKLFNEGVDTDTRFFMNSHKRPAICLCVENNDIDMAQLMMGFGASVNQKDLNDQTPLHITCGYGYVSMAALLLGNRANVHSRDKNGQTPLHLAAKTDKTELVDLLIHYGADANSEDKLGRTPLHLAALISPSHVLKKLLYYGADATVRDNCDNTALHFAVDSLGTSLEGISALSEAYPLAALQSNQQMKTPLHIIVGADRRGEEEALRVMLGGLSWNTNIFPSVLLSPRSGMGHTPLHLAVLERKVTLVRILIASGVEVDTRDQLGRTPLDCAVRDTDWNIVALLLAAGASIRRLFNEKGLLPHVKDDTISEILVEAASRPMELTSLCRRVISRTLGPKLQRNLENLPLTWREFLSYEEL